jgi:predicted glycogen debranching enzyme
MSQQPIEWLEADGLGGFASGTSTGIRTRRYHGVLLAATTPPTGRVMLVNGFEIWVESPAGRQALSSQRYAPDVVHPDGAQRLEAFVNDPWPRWTYRLADDLVIEQELVVLHGAPITAVSWRLRTPRADVRLEVRPLISGRDYHSTHHENGSFDFAAEIAGEKVTWRPYAGVPGIVAFSNGRYESHPDWFRNFLYLDERSRGLDDIEDLASPGLFTFELSRPAVMLLTTDAAAAATLGPDAAAMRDAVSDRERRRRVFASPLHRAADTYLVRRGSGQTIVAGYPWFTDWGRDTFIAIRGLCIASGRLDDARDILLAWAGTVSDGMLPNRFPDRGDQPEFNSVDASLWYVIAVHDFLTACDARGIDLRPDDSAALRAAVDAILAGYARGTRYGIHADTDGLLPCGEPGVQLTWMDAKVGDWVVTPRTGKPVEIQALWLNALWVAGHWSETWRQLLETGSRSFRARFWNEADGALYDVVDADHVPGRVDASFRPNQIFAVGGLPLVLLDKEIARQVVDAVEARLVTPMGLRSLAPGAPGYAPRYEGNGAERDARYHQGTVWPWLMGPFVEAWLRVRRPSARARAEARERFLLPLLQVAGPRGGQLPEIADADAPHLWRGCPQQAWSVGELLRMMSAVTEPKRLTAGAGT